MPPSGATNEKVIASERHDLIYSSHSIGRCANTMGVKAKGKFLYSEVSNLQDCSKRFTLGCKSAEALEK